MAAKRIIRNTVKTKLDPEPDWAGHQANFDGMRRDWLKFEGKEMSGK